MSRYLLSIGSNCPDADAKMEAVREWLVRTFDGVMLSGVYSTKALNPSKPDYLNLVARADSNLSPTEMVAAAKEFEIRQGRSPESKNRGIVEMDIDVVQVDNTVLRPDEFSRNYFMEGFKRLNEKD